MTLRNYWWLLIWLFLAGAIDMAVVPKQEEIVLGRRCIRWNWLPATVLTLPYVIWAAWRPVGFGDTFAYRNGFRRAPSVLSDVWSYVTAQSKDRGYALIEAVFKSVVSQSYVAFFFFVAAIQIYSLASVYRKYSRNYWLSMFLFIASTDYLAWMYNGTRQFLAAAIIFAFFPLIVKKRYIPMAIVVFLASRIHLSALIVLPFIFIVQGKPWGWRTILFILGVIGFVYFLDEMTGVVTSIMEDTVYESDAYYAFFNQEDDGTNIFRVLFYSVPAILSLIFLRRIKAADDPLINVCVNMSIVTAGVYVISFFTSGILVGRLPIYFSLSNYILIPWLLTEIFEPSSALLMETGFVGVYCFFFYYQGITWGIL